MTPEQLATLKAFANADPTAAGYIATGNDVGLAAWFNASVPFLVYRTSVSRVEIQNEPGPSGSEWDWTVYKNQSASEQGAWRDMAMGDGINFSKEKVRAGIAKIFSGTGANAAHRSHVLSFATRDASRVESALSIGPGTTQEPATLTFEGTISPAEASSVRVA